MIKRGATPLSKDRFSTRNPSNQTKPFKDIKNLQQSKPSLSRNASNSKLIVPMLTEPTKHNPESADRRLPSKKQITDEMRKVVVEWMLEVSHRSTMKRETVFMAVRLFDCGLAGMKEVGITNVQLLATTAMFMSAKYEEIYPESLNKFLDYTLNSYMKHDILMMEEKILTLMGFRLTFETRFIHAGMIMEKELSYGPNAKKLKSMVVFLLELSLLAQWEDYSENELGEAGVFLASKVLKYPSPAVSDRVMEIAFQLMGVWRENEGGVIAYLFDCEKESYVGGLKVIY